MFLNIGMACRTCSRPMLSYVDVYKCSIHRIPVILCIVIDVVVCHARALTELFIFINWTIDSPCKTPAGFGKWQYIGYISAGVLHTYLDGVHLAKVYGMWWWWWTRMWSNEGNLLAAVAFHKTLKVGRCGGCELRLVIRVTRASTPITCCFVRINEGMIE